MSSASYAADYTNLLMKNSGFTRALAVRVASRDCNIKGADITREFARRRKPTTAAKKKSYQSTVPVWVRERE